MTQGALLAPGLHTSWKMRTFPEVEGLPQWSGLEKGPGRARGELGGGRWVRHAQGAVSHTGLSTGDALGRERNAVASWVGHGKREVHRFWPHF